MFFLQELKNLINKHFFIRCATDETVNKLTNFINKGFKRRKLKEILHFKSSLVYHTKGLFYFLIPFILNKQDF